MPGTIHFHKLHVCGNDFVAVTERDTDGFKDLALVARMLCDRRVGVGADQLLVLGMGEIGEEPHIRLKILNPNGSYAPFCGNACLAVAAHASSLLGDARHLVVKVWGNTIYTSWESRGVWHLQIPPPTYYTVLARRPDAVADDHFVSNGTLHRIVLHPDLAKLDARSEGERLSVVLGVDGPSNVMFVGDVSVTGFSMVPWERGGTGLSLACGSGSCASAWVLWKAGLIGSRITVRCPGGALHIAVSDKGVEFGARPQHVFSGWFSMGMAV